MTKPLPDEVTVRSFLENFFPKMPVNLLVIIVRYSFLPLYASVYDIQFKAQCIDLGIILYPRIVDIFSVWQNRMSGFYPQIHARGVKCRQNGTAPVLKPQWVPTDLNNQFYLELCQGRGVGFRWRSWDGKIFRSPDEEMFLVTHKLPAVGEKVRRILTEKYVAELAYKLDTIVVTAVVKNYILMGVIKGNKWIFLVHIPFIYLVSLYLGNSSKKKTFYVDIPALEKNAPDTLVSPEPGKDVNKDKQLMFDPKGRFLIKLGNDFDIPLYWMELMTHLCKSEKVKKHVTDHWDILSKNCYFEILSLTSLTPTWTPLFR